MKQIWLVNSITGVIQGAGTISDDTDINTINVENSIVVEISPSNNMQVWKNDSWVDRPIQPGDNYEWIDEAWQLNKEKASAKIQQQRNLLLAETDWIVIKAVDQGTQVPQAWSTYRQQLRDITLQPNYPFTVTWPTPPN